MEGRPGIWNLVGLLFIAAGVAGLLWILVAGYAHAREVPERVELNWQPKLLMVEGPNAVTRNPMYVAELALWLGWAILFGSLAVSTAFVALCIGVSILARREERDLEARFGEAYRRYEKVVPRWLW
jgi:protein-S-isoprenylcysteine O-methyltransferase Ste14